MLSFSYKWLGEKAIYTKALCDYPLYKSNLENDFFLIKDLHKLFDEADILIAHNGDKFDIKKANARFIRYGMKPPAPWKSIDTCKAARKYFSFESNKLNDLGVYLGVGKKMANTGFDLWRRTMAGEQKAWNQMKQYNRRDVLLLERVYEHLRPYMATHPNLGLYQDRPCCPVCQSMDVQRRGIIVSAARKYTRYQCQGCGAWNKGEVVPKMFRHV
jgi:hypothetical protein